MKVSMTLDVMGWNSDIVDKSCKIVQGGCRVLLECSHARHKKKRCHLQHDKNNVWCWKVPPRFKLRLEESESSVITNYNYTMGPYVMMWLNIITYPTLLYISIWYKRLTNYNMRPYVMMWLNIITYPILLYISIWYKRLPSIKWIKYPSIYRVHCVKCI